MRRKEFSLEKWTSERIQKLARDQQLAFARWVSSNLVHCRVLQGRALLAIQRSRAYEECGASSVLHFASMNLALEPREARDLLRVAQRLERLPVLTEAVEQGTIEWSKLVAILRRATPESESEWLQRAQSNPMRVLERMLRQDAGATGDDTGETTRLVVEMTMEDMELLQRAMGDLCHEAGRRLGMNEVLRCFAFERLAGCAFPDQKTLDKWQTEVRLDLEARTAYEERADWTPASERADLTDEEPLSHNRAARAAEESKEANSASGSEGQENAPTPAPWTNKKLKFAREARLVTSAQRREIIRRDGYRCSVPDCPHTLFLECHHIVYYCHGGITAPENLVAVCSRCHRHIHRGLLRVVGEAPYDLRWFDRRGRTLGTSEQIPLVRMDAPIFAQAA